MSSADGGTDGGEPVPLLHPQDGTPTPLTTQEEIAALAHKLAEGSGPIAVDTERASGFRYGGRAYLVQLRRAGVGTALIDPIGLRSLALLNQPLRGVEWVLHAASQDLPCLVELGLAPQWLFDTELAGRLAGLTKVSLGPLVEQMLGLHLAKGHGADDWSRRPLPTSWLDYAALDVEVLVELRDAMATLLRSEGKFEWAEQEFAAILAAPSPAPRLDPWRRTSGIHGISDRRVLAAVRELWFTRDEFARQRDLAPHRVLPDSAIVNAATEMPTTTSALTKLPVFSGRAQRRQATRWFAALERARIMDAAALPPRRLHSDGPPPPNRWARKDPAAAARLSAARTALTELSDTVAVPVENLANPNLVRQVLWKPPASTGVAAALAAGHARPWQIELVAPVLIDALDARP